MSQGLAALAGVVLLVVGCTSAGAASGGVTDRQLLVLAAASLGSALERLEPAWASHRRDGDLIVATDSSAALRTQIEQGAPADVFLAADTDNPDRLVAAGLADGEPVPFAANLLTLIVPAGNPAGIASPADIARPGVRIAAAGPEVPLTRYAEQVVGRLAGLGGYPDGFAARYEANIQSREDNARAVVTRVELGEVDAALVYGSDAAASTRVETVPIPVGANVTATYAGVVVKATDDPESASAFLRWLAGPQAGAVFAELGFQPIRP